MAGDGMNALSWTAPREMKWIRADVPEPAADEALIRVETVGICGSEIEGYLGHNSLRVPPLVMGHEFCGVVERLGSGVDSLVTEHSDGEAPPLRVGARVVVNPLLFCGDCDLCRKGLTQLCRSRRIVGIHRPGAFGQYVCVPLSAIVPVPDALSPFRAALAEPLACSLRAAKRAMQRHRFPHVVVFGAGGIGLLCGMTARLLGAATLTVVDTNRARLDMALRAGFDAAIHPGEADVAAEVVRLHGSEGVDVVFDAAGFQPTRETALRLVNPGGTLMNVGLGIDETNMRVNHAIRSEIDILGSFCYTRQDFHEAVGLLVAGRVRETGWTEIRPLAEGAGAFADLVEGRVTSGKILLEA